MANALYSGIYHAQQCVSAVSRIPIDVNIIFFKVYDYLVTNFANPSALFIPNK